MLIKCKCGQELRVIDPPSKKIKVVCPKCEHINFVIVNPKVESNNCFICHKPCDENNLLQNGARYHHYCLKKLEGNTSLFEKKITDITNDLKSIRSKIRNEYHQRSIFQKLFSVVPDSIDELTGQKRLLEKTLRSLKGQREQELKEKDKKLREVYDYWLTKPPDWHYRSYSLRQQYQRCTKCGREAYRTNPLQVHHIIPVSHGGNHKPENLEVLCKACHQNEHHFEINNDDRLNSVSRYSTAKKSKSRYSILMDKIASSMKNSHYISFRYRRSEGVLDKHFVKAEEFISKDDGMYITAYCYLSNAKRDFKVKKMSKVAFKDSLPRPRLPKEFIKEALDNELMIYCHYTKRTGGKSLRTLKPIGYTTYGGVKVLECYDYLTEENRCFAPHRMNKIELVNKPKESKVITGTP